jgi:hypothetical protein
MELSFAHSNVAAVGGAWPVMGLSSHQQMHAGPSDRIVGCSHFSRQHHGDRSAPRRRHTRRGISEAGHRQPEHVVQQGITGEVRSAALRALQGAAQASGCK